MSNIVRGGLHFVILPDNVIQVWLGMPHDSESEYVMGINKDYLGDLIAGLTAIKTQK